MTRRALITTFGAATLSLAIVSGGGVTMKAASAQERTPAVSSASAPTNDQAAWPQPTVDAPRNTTAHSSRTTPLHPAPPLPAPMEPFPAGPGAEPHAPQPGMPHPGPNV